MADLQRIQYQMNQLSLPKENKIIATSKPVILLFSKYHDEDNTIPAELEEVEALKNEKVPNCVKATYNGNRDRIMIGERYFAEIQFATLHV